MPNRGTLSAWREILLKVEKSKFIYEFDIRNFFGEVEINKVTEGKERSTKETSISFRKYQQMHTGLTR